MALQMEISFAKGKLCPVSKAFLVSADSQNNPYAKEAHFGGAYSVTLQGQGF